MFRRPVRIFACAAALLVLAFSALACGDDDKPFVLSEQFSEETRALIAQGELNGFHESLRDYRWKVVIDRTDEWHFYTDSKPRVDLGAGRGALICMDDKVVIQWSRYEPHYRLSPHGHCVGTGEHTYHIYPLQRVE